MKVAAVSMMCQDGHVFRAMMMAGTPCPFNGLIGEEARAAWLAHPELTPVIIEEENARNDTIKSAVMGFSGIALLLLLLYFIRSNLKYWYSLPEFIFWFDACVYGSFWCNLFNGRYL